MSNSPAGTLHELGADSRKLGALWELVDICTLSPLFKVPLQCSAC